MHITHAHHMRVRVGYNSHRILSYVASSHAAHINHTHRTHTHTHMHILEMRARTCLFTRTRKRSTPSDWRIESNACEAAHSTTAVACATSTPQNCDFLCTGNFPSGDTPLRRYRKGYTYSITSELALKAAHWSSFFDAPGGAPGQPLP